MTRHRGNGCLQQAGAFAIAALDFGMHPTDAAAPRFRAFLYGQTRRWLRIESRIS